MTGGGKDGQPLTVACGTKLVWIDVMKSLGDGLVEGVPLHH